MPAARLKERVRVVGGTANHRAVWIETAPAVRAHEIAIDHRLQVVIGDALDLHHLVRCPKPIEEMHERHTRAQRCGVGNDRQILRFLDGCRRQHGPTGLTGGHHVQVVAKDGQSLRCH